MKKLILSVAIVLGTMSVQAAVPSITKIMSQSVITQDEYTEVSLDALPAAVKSTVEKSFPGTKLEKAYKNEKNEFKLEIANGDKKYTVYTDASGNIIKK
ncbi:PepSY-like domain-containing protein [Flavobacterium sp. Fl-77]|uniref:PepSY-like domain-containing protein n=1 Tax=Flavobacterium flavipigmentatum TaxID=2893884 RepID=A0AAJ2VWL0_9FLAO|nr:MULTISPECIES: PepSY-like domain-containing protein [unclassified Flavobacterium]MDX6180659.1 PepSY-like domain-containing protein [Flavobacterium sp. Fl-33]MDX6184259.1 PepSY-like domain-containing protein [Flavobacterium sp. Fl-77]UFH39371.1 PepSY-like domain-containing protein [Flavobacterium sp. F-70]